MLRMMIINYMNDMNNGDNQQDAMINVSKLSILNTVVHYILAPHIFTSPFNFSVNRCSSPKALTALSRATVYKGRASEHLSRFSKNMAKFRIPYSMVSGWSGPKVLSYPSKARRYKGSASPSLP